MFLVLAVINHQDWALSPPDFAFCLSGCCKIETAVLSPRETSLDVNDNESNPCQSLAAVLLCVSQTGAAALSPLCSQGRCAPWWRICSRRSPMMTTAPQGKRQQSKQTPSAGIPGGTESRWVSAVPLPSVFGIFARKNRSHRVLCDGRVRERGNAGVAVKAGG